ncbi:hypothetical protein CPC08DRAFT_749160 [Agrocybe pediades]|nr:hypothetical protein CPC08DRAFT_749160 [Agrocybe pediades]
MYELVEGQGIIVGSEKRVRMTGWRSQKCPIKSLGSDSGVSILLHCPVILERIKTSFLDFGLLRWDASSNNSRTSAEKSLQFSHGNTKGIRPALTNLMKTSDIVEGEASEYSPGGLCLSEKSEAQARSKRRRNANKAGIYIFCISNLSEGKSSSLSKG